MKAAEAKSVASPAKSSSSFFSKGADSSFFCDSATHADFFQRKSENSFFFVQPKLNVSEPNDRYEKEADATADRVVQKMEEKENAGKGKNELKPSITPLVQRKCDQCAQEEKVQRKESGSEEVQLKEEDKDKIKRKEQDRVDKTLQKQTDANESQMSVVLEDGKRREMKLRLQNRRTLRNQSRHQLQNEPQGSRAVNLERKADERERDNTVQRKANSLNAFRNKAQTSIENNLSASKGAGRPLPETILRQMENSFGVDFSQIRIHDNSMAVQMSRDLHAQAFTHGNDIYFNTGKFDGNSHAGMHLLAHELTHTIQQGGARPKQVQQKSAHTAGPNPAHATVNPSLSSTEKKIAKQDEEDGFLMEQAKEALWSLLREASPEVYDIFRVQGFSNWAKGKVADFVNSTVNTFSEPIRLGASIISLIKSNFHLFRAWMVTAIERLKQGDCSPFVEATDFINNILEGIADPVLDRIKTFLAPIKRFIDHVWNDIGKPIWDFVSRIFGRIWDGIKWVAERIWNHIQTVILVYADIWHWFARAIGFEGDDQDSLWEQVKRKVLSLWEEVKQALEPYKTQLMILGGIILLLSPAGPFIVAGAMITGIMYAASRIRHYIIHRDAIIRERGFINGVLIPGLFQAIQSLSTFLRAKITMISGTLRTAVISLQSIPQDVSALMLTAINMAVNWLTEKFVELEAWANVQATQLIVNLQLAFARIRTFLQPITRILAKIGRAMTNYIQLGFLILDDLFHRIPKCIRDKIIAFFVKYIFKHIPLLREVQDVEGAWTAMRTRCMLILNMMFVHGDVKGALWEVFNLLLEVLRFPAELAVRVFNKAFEVFDSIIERPRVFFVNMLQTAKLGFIGFFERKWTHLREGFTTWLFDAVQGSPIYIPRAFNFTEIFRMLGSLFSVGMEKVYRSIERKRGAELAARVRLWISRIGRAAGQAWSWVVALHEHSLDEIITMIRDRGAELLQTLVDSVIDWLVSNIITRVSARLVSMLDPTGIMAVVNSIVTFYRAVETAIDRAREILELVEGVLDNVGEVMAGTFMNAALRFENNLQRAIPLFLEFLSNQVSMSRVGRRIREMATRAEEWIDEKIDWLVDRLLAAGDWLVDRGREAIAALVGWWTAMKSFRARDGRDHELYFDGEEENATLMVASRRGTTFESFIRNVPVANDDDKRRAQQAALPIAQEIDREKMNFIPRTLPPEERRAAFLAKKARLDSLLNNLSEHVAILISEGDLPDGSYENPIAIRWTKRGHVLAITDLIPKDSLWRSRGMVPPDPIESAPADRKTRVELPPTTRRGYSGRNEMPGEGTEFIMIGVDSENFVRIGDKLQRSSTSGSGAEKDRFRRLMTENYHLTLSGYDFDHVKDLGFGGRDQVANLWPLQNDLNRNWGNFVYRQTVSYRDAEGRPQVSTPMDLRNKWFVVNEIGDI